MNIPTHKAGAVGLILIGLVSAACASTAHHLSPHVGRKVILTARTLV